MVRSDELITPETAFVVKYRLTSLDEGHYPWAAAQFGADPDPKDAAFCMRNVVNDNPGRRNRIAAAFI